MPPSSHTERREYVKYQLRLRGSSLAEVGRELGVSTATVSQVCGGMRTSERIQRTIAEKLEAPVGAPRCSCRDEEGLMRS